ncbi:MAG TPA: 50S ribosomal protein L4 [Gammaproteobacteria bacterium]|nr:50S ribosomal protein L4 [Gammaproteobacteria bacterium]
MELNVSGSKKATIEVAEGVFGCKFNEPLIHQIVTAFLAAGRAGTVAQKTRSEVRGGGAKPFRQKGTGRARAGTIRSPIWRKGGVVFAAKPRNYEQKVNKKMYRSAIRSILSEMVRLERLVVIESFLAETPKTRDLIKSLAELKMGQNVVIITEAVDENLYLASRNLPYVEARDVAAVDPVCLVGAEKVLITVAALRQLEELLK